jgi:hypothetical protein
LILMGDWCGVISDTATPRRRDCEILFMHAAGPLATGCVYTTYGLNECPATQWEALDPKKLVREYQVDQAIMNGPRFWPCTSS